MSGLQKDMSNIDREEKPNFIGKEDTSYLALYGFARLWYNIKQFFIRLCGPAFCPQRGFDRLSVRNRIAIILSYFYMGIGMAVQGRVEKALVYIFYETLFWLYMGVAGFGSFVGMGPFSGGLNDIGLIFTSALLICTVYFYFRSVTDTVEYARFLDLFGGSKDENITLRLLRRVKNHLQKAKEKLRDAYSHATPLRKTALTLGLLVSGACHLVCRRFVKGFLFLAVEVAYIIYMVLRGGVDLVGLFTLHTEGVGSDYSLAFGLVCLFLTLAFAYSHISSIRSGVETVCCVNHGEQPSTAKQDFEVLKNKKLYILFLIIPVIGAILFTILPLVFMICVAFTNYATSSSLGVIPNVTHGVYLKWVGFASFENLFRMNSYFSAFVSVLSWTLIWAFFATFTCYFGGILLALLINKKVVKCKVLFRSIFVVTMATPQLVTMRVMYAMFHDQGPINAMLVGLGGQAISFWGDPVIAKVLIILINMWVGIPYFMLLISGLLINIPTEMYESARTEGASRFYIFRKITMPYLLFMTAPLLITNFVSNINNFNVIWLLTGGGPAGTDIGTGAGGTDILITWLYKLTMQSNPNYNLGSAIGIIMFIISAGLSLLIYRNTSSYKKEEEFA